ncbi:MAG: hypothetical protein K8S27_15290 [Candidatus Omnitrophica bacterium]|nr:hypothetical protein [Candidatus Omnitrophota bacterium]
MGSCAEVETLIDIDSELKYISQSKHEDVKTNCSRKSND